MPKRLRNVIFWLMGALWASGCLWLALDQFFSGAGQFGPMPHPWQPTVLLLHGITAIAATYLLGWVTARHVLHWWKVRQRRLSGAMLAAILAALSVSGFALFFLTDDRWQRASAAAHDVLGVFVTVFAIQHWFFANRRDMRNAASRP